MMPILYAESERNFADNGIGILADAVSASVYREINGQYELTLVYPETGIHAGSLADRAIILVPPDPYTPPEAFRIYRINPVCRGNITVNARHVAYDLQKVPIPPFEANNIQGALDAINTSAVIDHPFYLWRSWVPENLPMVSEVPQYAWDLMGRNEGSILDIYGGEWEFRRFRVGLHARLGMDRGVEIRYGKNLRTAEQDRNCAAVYDGIYPYWRSSDGLLLELSPPVIDLSGTGNPEKIYIMDLSSEWDDMPSIEALQSHAIALAQKNGITTPAISWTIKFEPLRADNDLLAELEQVHLGDDVRVIFPRMSVDAAGRTEERAGTMIDVKARVVATTYDPIREWYDDIALGQVKDDLAKTIIAQNERIARTARLNVIEIVKANLGTYDKSLTQRAILDRLTNGGAYQGIYMVDGDIYFNGTYIRGSTIDAENIGLSGKFSVYDGINHGGYLGFMPGSTDTETTNGIGIADASDESRVVATNGGVRIQSGGTKFYITKDGAATLIGNLIVKGNIMLSGNVEQLTE